MCLTSSGPLCLQHETQVKVQIIILMVFYGYHDASNCVSILVTSGSCCLRYIALNISQTELILHFVVID